MVSNFPVTLLHANSLSRHGEVTSEDEELTPTLENFIVLTWLNWFTLSYHASKLVKQRYGTELKSWTLASMKLKISQNLTSANDAKIMCTDVTCIIAIVSLSAPELHTRQAHDPTAQLVSPVHSGNRQTDPTAATSWASECSFLPDEDCKYIAKARQITNIFDNLSEPRGPNTAAELDSETNDTGPRPSTKVFCIQMCQLLYLDDV